MALVCFPFGGGWSGGEQDEGSGGYKGFLLSELRDASERSCRRQRMLLFAWVVDNIKVGDSLRC